MESTNPLSQLELVLENIRLRSIEKLIQESTTQEELQRGVQLINESFYLVEEAFKIDSQAKAQKFARRATKVLSPDMSTVTKEQLPQAAAAIITPKILPIANAIPGAVLGAGAGAIVDGLDSNEEDPITASTGALIGAGAGALRGLVLNRNYGPGRTKPIEERLQRDGGQLSQDDLDTLRRTSNLAASVNLHNRTADLYQR